jgi:hypothetical protein
MLDVSQFSTCAVLLTGDEPRISSAYPVAFGNVSMYSKNTSARKITWSPSCATSVVAMRPFWVICPESDEPVFYCFVVAEIKRHVGNPLVGISERIVHVERRAKLILRVERARL